MGEEPVENAAGVGDDYSPLPEPGAQGVPRRRRGRLGLLIGLGAAVGVLVVAIVVTSSSRTASAAKLVVGAADRNAASTVHFTAAISVTKGGAPLTSIRMNGDEDPRTRQATLTIDAGPATAEIRLIDGIEYFRSGLAKLPEGKSWVKIDPAAVGITQTAAAPSDPMAQLQLLGGLVGQPTRVGADTIDGVAVTRYDVTLDFTNVFDKVAKGASALGGSDSFVKGLEALEKVSDLHHVPGHVALDNEGRARAFSFELHITGPKGSIDEGADMTFTDFGKPVMVTAPPSEQVVPFSEVPDVFKNLTGG